MNQRVFKCPFCSEGMITAYSDGEERCNKCRYHRLPIKKEWERGDNGKY